MCLLHGFTRFGCSAHLCRQQLFFITMLRKIYYASHQDDLRWAYGDTPFFGKTGAGDILGQYSATSPGLYRRFDGADIENTESFAWMIGMIYRLRWYDIYYILASPPMLKPHTITIRDYSGFRWWRVAGAISNASLLFPQKWNYLKRKLAAIITTYAYPELPRLFGISHIAISCREHLSLRY